MQLLWLPPKLGVEEAHRLLQIVLRGHQAGQDEVVVIDMAILQGAVLNDLKVTLIQLHRFPDEVGNLQALLLSPYLPEPLPFQLLPYYLGVVPLENIKPH